MTKMTYALLLLLIATTLNAKIIIPSPLEISYQRGTATLKSFNGDSIKVMVWNIYKGKKDDFKRDFEAYGADRDLFMIQEFASTSNVLSAMDSLAGVGWNVGVSFKYGNWSTDKFSGTMLGSTTVPDQINLIRSKDFEPVVGTPKVLVIGSYQIKGSKNLLAINIHGMNRAGNDAFKTQVGEAIKHIKSHQGPIIFAGDFNSLNKKRTSFLNDKMKELGFFEIKFRNDRRRKSSKGNQFLDYSFIRGLEVIDAEVLGNMYSSDHNAMYFEVKVKD